MACRPPSCGASGREQLALYDSVEIRDITVVDAQCRDYGFEVELEDGTRLTTRKLLLATGVIDDLPPIEGAEAFYGRGLHHCPYCDGWELRDQPLAVYGGGAPAMGMALELTMWSRELGCLRERRRGVFRWDREQLHAPASESARSGSAGWRAMQANSNASLCFRRSAARTSAVSLARTPAMRSGRAARLQYDRKAWLDTGKFETTAVRGGYVAGDASRNVQLVVIAAAEGATAAFAINTELVKEDLG